MRRRVGAEEHRGDRRAFPADDRCEDLHNDEPDDHPAGEQERAPGVLAREDPTHTVSRARRSASRSVRRRSRRHHDDRQRGRMRRSSSQRGRRIDERTCPCALARRARSTKERPSPTTASSSPRRCRGRLVAAGRSRTSTMNFSWKRRSAPSSRVSVSSPQPPASAPVGAIPP